MIARAVLDTSVALSRVLPGEETAKTLPLRDIASDYPRFDLSAPSFFCYEVANALWAAQKRKRISSAVAKESLKAILDFDIKVWDPDPLLCLNIAFEKNLAVYDCAYLALAMEQKAFLWTIDRSLAAIAGQLGVAVKPG